MLTEIRLYGHLGARFGKVHHYAVNSVTQAMNALAANLPGFRQYMIEHSAPGYYVIAGKNQVIPEGEIALKRDIGVLKLVPGVEGGKAAGAGQMILGAVLMVAAVALAFVPGMLTSSVPGAIFKIGLYMFLGGVSAYLSQPPRTNDEKMKAETAKSYAFDGAENVMAQGGPVSVVYGMLEVGSTVGALGIYTEDLTGASDDPEDDDAANTAFHIARPLHRTELNADQGPSGCTVNIPCTAANGTAPYTFTLDQDGGGRFAISAGALVSAEPSGLVPPGSYHIVVRCVDSAALEVTKEISVRISDGGTKDSASSIYIPPTR